MKRALDLTIHLDGNDLEIEIYEPESGETAHMRHPYSPDEHPEFDANIGNEIYSWISLWKDEEEAAASSCQYEGGI